jgi:tRNA-splicing ligase RtcB
VHNHHNYAWRERHGSRDVWVVRKGATPAFPGQRGFVGGSMGDDAVILSGIESERAAASFYSTVHGAGRVMSRTEARGKRNRKTGAVIAAGRISPDAMQAWLRTRGVMLLGADLDEAPQAYRRLPEVLAHHDGTVKIEHRLRPFAVAMAGADVFDPFKD